MADKIATRQDINNLKSEAFSSELNRCPIYSEISGISGLVINGSYSNNQLVPLVNISTSTEPIPEKDYTPIAYPFVFSDNTYVTNSNFNASDAFYEDLVFPIGYLVFDWLGFQTDDLSHKPGIAWNYDISDLDWINNSKILLWPSGAIGKSISATTPSGDNADMGDINSMSIEFDNQFLNRLPSENNMIVYIFNSSTISSDRYIGQVIYKNPKDDELLDPTYPMYKWSPDLDSLEAPPEAYNREIFSSTNISTPLRFTANEITSYTPSTGSIFSITESHTDVALRYPIAKADNYLGSGYETLTGYLSTGVKAIDLSTLTGNLNCTVTINIDSKFGSNVRIGAYINAESSTGTDFIIGTGDSEINQLALVETGKDVTFAYTINMADSTSPSGYHFSGITYFVYSVDGEQTIISDSTTISKLLNSFLPGLGYTGEKALEMIENNQFLKYLHKNIKITITDVETFTVEII